MKQAALPFTAALLLALPAGAEGFHFTSYGFSLEGGGYEWDGGYGSASMETRAEQSFGLVNLTLDLSLGHALADAIDDQLTSAEVLAHFGVEARPWLTLGPYVMAGSYSGASYSRDGAGWALGVEALVETRSGWMGEIYFGESRGAPWSNDGYATNRGLYVGYQPEGVWGGHGFFAKDTVNETLGDSDFYRAGVGVDRALPLPNGRAAELSVEVGQRHFDLSHRRENWAGLSVTIPLGAGHDAEASRYTNSRNVISRLPRP